MPRPIRLSACVLLATGSAGAQWSSNPGANLAVADRAGEQVQPKVRSTADGGVYISWFDNAAGGYDVYLQRLSTGGVEQWAHNGVLVADRSFSSTQDYGLAVDAGGNALITYRDDRAGGVQIGVNRVSPAGVLLWGPSGVLVTSTSEFVANPKVCATSDGFVVVAWTQGSNAVLQKLDGAGVPQWPAPAVVSPTSGSYTVTDVVPSDGGSVIVGLVKGTQRHLHAQRIGANGAAAWAAPVVVFDGSALQFGYFPAPLPDGAGGAVFAWYETGSVRNAYAQRLTGAGAEVFPHNGVAVSTTTSGRIRLSPGFSYSPSSGDIFVFWVEANSTQTMWGVSGQRISTGGARVWGDAAREVVPLGPEQPAFVKSVVSGDGAMAFWFDRSGAAQVVGVRLDGAGNLAWPGSPRVICSVLSGKSRLDADVGAGAARLVWGDARTDANDIYAQNVNADGSLGPAACYPDCNGDGALNLADFGCFQTKFALQDPFADCNGDGALNLADFGCFQTKFALGCP